MLIFSLRREARISGEAASFELLRQILADLHIPCEVTAQERSAATPWRAAIARFRQLKKIPASQSPETLLVKIPTAAQLPFVLHATRHFRGRRIVWVDGLLWKPLSFRSMMQLMAAEPLLNMARAIINNRAWLRLVRHRAVELVVASETQRAELEPLLQAARIHVVPNGSPAPENSVAVPIIAPPRSGVFGYIGHAYRTKGVFNILEAYRILKNRGIDIPMEFALSGLGAEQLCHELARETIPVHGEVDKTRFYQSLRALLAPFWTDWGTQTFPNILLEALEFGVPVITSDLPACRELFGPNLALFVPPNDSDALADLLARIHSGQTPLPAPEKLRAHFAAHFSRELIAGRWRNILAGNATASSSPIHG